MIKIGSVPVKTRVPLTAWAVAGVLTLVSLASTLTHSEPGSMVADHAYQRVVGVNQHARMN
jgi:hypothetical protein